MICSKFTHCPLSCLGNIYVLEVKGPSGPQLLVGGPSGRLDFVLRALRALTPCDPRNDVVSVRNRMVSVRMLTTLRHIAWVTRLERPKGAKDDVKVACRATN